MPPFEELDGGDDLLLWEFVDVDRYNETVRSARQVPVTGRLVRRARSVPSSTGTPTMTDAQLATDRDVPLNSLVWEGTEADWDPGVEQEVFEVTSLLGKGKDLKGRVTRYEYGLNFYKGALPDAATAETT